MTEKRQFKATNYSRVIIYVLTALLCSSYVFAVGEDDASQPPRYRVFRLTNISADKGREYLGELAIGTVSQIPGTEMLLVTGQPEELIKASAIIGLVDTDGEFALGVIGPALETEKLPDNSKIAAEIGDISIGTFAEPPVSSDKAKAIVDVHNDTLIAIGPAEQLEGIISAVIKVANSHTNDNNRPAAEANSTQETTESTGSANDNAPDSDVLFEMLAEAEKMAAEQPNESEANDTEVVKEQPDAVAVEEIEKEIAPDVSRQSEPDTAEIPEADGISDIAEKSKAIAEQPAAEGVRQLETHAMYEPQPVSIGEQEIELSLPEKLNIVDLLDLVGKYLDLDYMYDAEEVKGEVALRVQGPIKIKELYPLLESVLKFKGFAMTRKGNLVTIISAAKVLEIDPGLYTDSDSVEYGNVMITRIFKLRHISTASAKNLLDGMKLGANITPIAETGTLIVTGYTYRMGRIEELLDMIDKPGEPKQFRYRQLKYTMANVLVTKVEKLAKQLGTVSVSVSAAPPKTAAKRGRQRPSKPVPKATAKQTETAVYLDADERTNRILMIGFDEQLKIVDDLIDSLDIQQQDLRRLRLYEIQNVGAEEVMKKLEELGIIGSAVTTAAVGQTAKPKSKEASPAAGEMLAEPPQVIIVESTNSLLVNATDEQHLQIVKILGYVDSAVLAKAIPYRIYPLENQPPEDLAEVLNRLVQETIKDAEGKIQKVIKEEEEITIIGDENTFSIIVYASQKNQEWIGNLIKQLDKRRPQVLINVTLVEVSRTDLFDLDLQLASKFSQLAPGGTMESGGLVDALVSPFPAGRVTEASSIINAAGKLDGRGFYSDRHIQALLTAMQSKEYGRILAQPKVLVNDNEEGLIKTTEKTYVEETTVSWPGDPPQQVETTKYVPYEAKIELTITPHISEGDLLRLEVIMVREDFIETTEGPPDYATSNINTIVTVPDGSTIILGGLTKLKQTKGGSKVPLLGDIPVVGGLFRSTSNTDRESKLYVFVKANVLRPEEAVAGLSDLERISRKNRATFEQFEEKFQGYEDWPGVKPEPMDPLKVLEEE